MAKYSLKSYSQMMLDDCIALLTQYPASRIDFDAIMSIFPEQQEDLERQLNQLPDLKEKFNSLFTRDESAMGNHYYSRNMAIYFKNALTGCDPTLSALLKQNKKRKKITELLEYSTTTVPGRVYVDEKSKAHVDMFIKHSKELLADDVVFEGVMWSLQKLLIGGARQALEDIKPVLKIKLRIYKYAV